jgi:hypothetical protein
LLEGRQAPDDNTAGYCQARARLPLTCLRKAHAKLAEWLDATTPGWCPRTPQPPAQVRQNRAKLEGPRLESETSIVVLI